MSGLELEVEGLCSRCGCEGLDLVVLDGKGVCRSCVDRPPLGCSEELAILPPLPAPPPPPPPPPHPDSKRTRKAKVKARQRRRSR